MTLSPYGDRKDRKSGISSRSPDKEYGGVGAETQRMKWGGGRGEI